MSARHTCQHEKGRTPAQLTDSCPRCQELLAAKAELAARIDAAARKAAKEAPRMSPETVARLRAIIHGGIR